jgi:hypothetical protein
VGSVNSLATVLRERGNVNEHRHCLKRRFQLTGSVRAISDLLAFL